MTLIITNYTCIMQVAMEWKERYDNHNVRHSVRDSYSVTRLGSYVKCRQKPQGQRSMIRGKLTCVQGCQLFKYSSDLERGKHTLIQRFCLSDGSAKRARGNGILVLKQNLCAKTKLSSMFINALKMPPT